MNFPIEVYTIIIECLLIFYFFHKEVRPVYPSRRYIILFCISLFAVIMLSTLYTPMFIRLVIISLFLFLCYTFCFKCKIFQITYTIILFYVDVFRCYWCVCTFQTWNFNKWTFRNKWRTAYLQYHKQDYSSVFASHNYFIYQCPIWFKGSTACHTTHALQSVKHIYSVCPVHYLYWQW